MLAMVCAGKFNTVEEAAKTLIKVKTIINPDAEITKRYETKYNQFKKIYPTCKGLFKGLNK